MRSLAVALWLGAGVACATMPPIPLPAWVQVDLTMARAPELDRAAPVKLELEALVGALPGTKWELVLPEQLELVSGARSGTVDLAAAKPHVVLAEVKARAPLEGANLSVEVTTVPPRQALTEQVEKTSRGEPEKRAAGVRLIGALPKQDVQRRIVGLTVSAEEGILAEAADPAYRRIVKSADGKALFALLDAVPGVDAGGIEAQLKVVAPKLATFRRLASGKVDDPLARFVADLTIEAAKLAYQKAVLALAAGKVAEARAGLAAADASAPASLENARRMALAVAVALGGDAAGALKELAELEPRLKGPAMRYLELNRAEVHRRAGRVAEAKAAYVKAMALGPSFTLARKRLSELK